MHIDENLMVCMHECMAPSTPDTSDTDWRLIRAFVAVIETGSLTAAARRLGTTQPTVGRQIRDLETRSGDVLFLRRGTALEPTERARELFPRALEIDRAIAGLSEDFARPESPSGPRLLRLTLSTLFADEMLPGLLPEFWSANGGIELEILPTDTVQDLYRRDADIAIRHVEPRQPDLITRRLGDIGIGFYASRDYLARFGAPETPADLADHHFIALADKQDFERRAAALGLAGRLPARILRSDDLRHRLKLLRAGQGIGTCHHWIARRDDRLVRLLPEIEVDRLGVWIVANDDLRRSRHLRTAFDHLAAAIRRQISGG